MSKIHPSCRGVAAAALIITAGALASSADAATAPLQAATSGVTHALPHQQVGFSLSARFGPTRSTSANTVVRGSYDHNVPSGGRTCIVRLQAIGVLQRSVPRARDVAAYWGARRLNITNSGTTAGLHWYVGKAGWHRIAYAYRLAPKVLASASRRYVAYKMVLSTATPETAPSCSTAVAADRAALTTAIRSAHIRTR